MKKARVADEPQFRYRGAVGVITDEVESAECKFHSLVHSEDFHTIAGTRDMKPDMKKGKVAFFIQSLSSPPVFRCVGVSFNEYEEPPETLVLTEVDLPLDRVFFDSFQGELFPETYTIQDLNRKHFNNVKEVDFSKPVRLEMARDSEIFGICNTTLIQGTEGKRTVILKYEYPNDVLIFLENKYQEKLKEAREKNRDMQWVPEHPSLDGEAFLQHAHVFFGNKASLIKYLTRVLRDPKHPNNEAFMKGGI